jgi:hypothetical protein
MNTYVLQAYNTDVCTTTYHTVQFLLTGPPIFTYAVTRDM